ncbi:MAG: hypothetical protein QOD06_1548 [Candidatus Binatota bacterium]|jgi:peroxiredoxin|nr:hypothetical protein [Candidatus Binatota bacterium]
MTSRRLRVVFCAILLAVGCRKAPLTAPEFMLSDLSGKVVRLSDLRGKVVLLNVWTTWCPPCVQEMPTLEELGHAMRGKDFVLLAVSQDEQPDAVRPWVDKNGLDLAVLLDPRGAVGHDYGVTGYPETFVIDRQGRIVHHHIGFRNWSEPTVVSAIEKLLATGEWTPIS